MLITIENEVCKECLVTNICTVSCRNYSMVHGTMMSWLSRTKEYNVTENEFKIKLEELIETWVN